MQKLFVILLFISILFFSCEPYAKNEKINTRVSVQSIKNETYEIRVFVEGLDGQVITGASVILINENNQITHIPFNTDEWCYFSEISITNDEILKLNVDSILLENSLEMEIPCSPLKNKPIITSIQDSSGVSVFLGNNPSSSKDIQVAWDSCGDDITYYLTIKNALSAVYATSTEQNQLVIPGGILESGTNYYATVRGQKINGDPMFKTSSYYFVSVIESSQVGFLVE